ncbi:MAG TPA: hypothetical protein VLK82_05050 [Candidatus Tectomicrobia bacterium]|nr:hypothetical protein [Candidatus Tectomicrobia bacterium]
MQRQPAADSGLTGVPRRQTPACDMCNHHPHWSAMFVPGQAATLRVTFDPNDHGPEGLGPRPKTVRITTGIFASP